MRRKKYILILTAALFCVFFCTGCVGQPADSLYALPKQPDEYYELQSAIDQVLGTGASYSGPLTGSNQQAVQLADLDGDGQDEAIVFVKVAGPKSLKAYIFDSEQDGAYQNTAVIEGDGSAFDSADYVQIAFDVADQYRNPVMVVADGMIGQMMEAIEWRELPKRELPEKTWATTGTKGERKPNVINSLYIDPNLCAEHNERLAAKYKAMEENEVRWEEVNTEDCEILFVAYGTPSRVTKAAIKLLEKEGIKAGLFRPITLWPFPAKQLKATASQPTVKAVIDFELSMGQMIDDVKIALEGCRPVSFVGKAGGVVPTPAEVASAAKAAIGR